MDLRESNLSRLTVAVHSYLRPAIEIEHDVKRGKYNSEESITFAKSVGKFSFALPCSVESASEIIVLSSSFDCNGGVVCKV